MRPELVDTWSRIDAGLRGAVPSRAYRTWLASLQPRELTGSMLVIAAPPAIQRWVAERFEPVLQTCAAAVLGPDISVEVVSADDPGPTPRDPGSVWTQGAVAHSLNPQYTFDQFVIGEGNRLAHAAALAVAELPAQAYNPLFIYGAPGLGKTHLLHAIARYLADYSPSVSVRCATVEQFTTQFVSALKNGGIDAFKASYRHADVLLLDDVQFLQRKAATEEELFHTFNALYDTGSQLVLTSDCLPRDMNELEERLRERFESGLLTDVQAPDFDARVAILRQRARHEGIDVPDPEVLDLVAARVTDNIRALVGALIRVVAYQSLTRRPLTSELTAHVLDQLYPRPAPRRRSIEEIHLATCAAFGLSPEELLSRDRSARVAWPRQIAMFLARELAQTSLPAIGRHFGGRNHTTVMHACRQAERRLARDARARACVERVREQLQKGRA